jgi:hypothetical protein
MLWNGFRLLQEELAGPGSNDIASNLYLRSRIQISVVISTAVKEASL